MVLETARLILRQMTLDDVDPLLQVFSDPETMRFYPKPFDRAMTQGWIEWNLNNYRHHGFGLWALVLKQSNTVVGDCGLVVQEVEGVQEVEIGYHVRRDVWGQGLATEAARACRDYGFNQLRRTRLISLIHRDNWASRRVAERNGMSLEKEITKWDAPICVYATTSLSQ